MLAQDPDVSGRLRDHGHDRPRHRCRRDHHRGVRRYSRHRSRDDQGNRLRHARRSDTTATPAASWSPSTSSRPTSARASTTSEEVRCGSAGEEDELEPAGRGRPGNDVRLRVRMRPTCSCRCRSTRRAPHGRAPRRGAQGRARFRTFAPTARPRSPSNTKATSSGAAQGRARVDPAQRWHRPRHDDPA